MVESEGTWISSAILPQWRQRKVGGAAGIEPGSPAYMAVALHFELLTTPVTMNEETLTDDP